MKVIKPDSLVLYKNRPARLLNMGDRIQIEFENKETARARPKDVVLLHPGPLRDLSELIPLPGDMFAAWELLDGSKTSLSELAELAYGSYTPASAWCTWQFVIDQLYFSGSPDEILVHSAYEVQRKKQERAKAEAEQITWNNFIEHARRGIFDPVDRRFLSDVENLALGKSNRSQVLRDLGRAETSESAHALLLELNVWDWQVNPYPVRQGIVLEQVTQPVPDLPVENRLDLTHLPAFAIDDEDTDTPDDAVSLDGNRIWVHIADVAALIEPGSPLDIEAQSRATSLHLPEGIIHLLPREVTLRLGLGMQEVTPAISFGLDLGPDGDIFGYEIALTNVRAKRLSYEDAENLVDQEPLRTLIHLADVVREKRRANRAVMIDFPEVKIRVINKKVKIDPIRQYRSRLLIEEAMILAGASTARYAIDHEICLPFYQQEAIDTDHRPNTLPEMVAFRRLLKRSHFHTTPAPHHGLGVPEYCQVTSPLRRYLDLVSHQQLRAYILGKSGLTSEQVIEKIGMFDAAIGSLRKAELDSERHWLMVFLLQNPDWRGEGILVDKRGATGFFILPELALETRIYLKRDLPLDGNYKVALLGVNLPIGEARFQLLD